jgi:biphenyl-2,3-diol 1,2-dioxygenase
MTHRVTALGYLGLGVSDLPAWRSFATDVLGLQASTEEATGALLLRMDGTSWRFRLEQSTADDILFAGYEVPNADALADVQERLLSMGVSAHKATAEECALRGVVAMFHCKDPDGLRTEVYYGPTERFELPFAPTRPLSGFVTGNQGLGHIVISIGNIAAGRHFYEAGLGFRVSDFITMGAPGHQFQLTFLHCNPRHHTVALLPVKTPKRLNHFMLQLKSIDDVGSTYDLIQDRGVPLTATLGRHTNDHMLSFYMRTPSGFDVEYGYGARTVDDETWNVVRHDAGSSWGHRRT